MALFAIRNTFVDTVSDDEDSSEVDRDSTKVARRASSLPPEAKKVLPEDLLYVRSMPNDRSTCAPSNSEECPSPRCGWRSRSSSCDGRWEATWGCWGLGATYARLGAGVADPGRAATGALAMSQSVTPALPPLARACGVQQTTLDPAPEVPVSFLCPTALGPPAAQRGPPRLAVTSACAPPALAAAPAAGAGQSATTEAPVPTRGRTSVRSSLDTKARLFVPGPASALPAAVGARGEESGLPARRAARHPTAASGVRDAEGAQGAPQPPVELSEVLRAVKLALAQEPRVRTVQITKAPMGGTSTLTAHVHAGSACSNDDLLKVAQAALMEANTRSEVVYIMGYGNQPFKDYGNGGGARFSASLALVERNQHHLACWETYQQGCCSKMSACRWRHPAATDLMRLVVEIKRASRK